MPRNQKAKPSGNGARAAAKLPPEMAAIAAMAPGMATPGEQGISAETSQEQVMDPAVLVVRIPGESPGQYNIKIMEVNGLDPFAVPALLKLAAKVKNLQLGLKEEE